MTDSDLDKLGGPPEWMDALDGKTFERQF